MIVFSAIHNQLTLMIVDDGSRLLLSDDDYRRPLVRMPLNIYYIWIIPSFDYHAHLQR